MNFTLIISIGFIVFALYRNGLSFYKAFNARDYSALKGTGLFLFLTIAVSVWQIWWVTKVL